jgi:hypothetical protein
MGGLTLLSENNIATKASRSPIGRGAAIDGHLLAKTVLTKEDLLRPGWILTVTCEDVRGAEAKVEIPISGHNAGAVLHQG